MWRLLIPVLLVAALILAWRQSQDHARTGREVLDQDAFPTREQGESDDAAPVATPVSVERAVIATLRGRVFDPNGRPVEKASVFVLRPEPLRLANTDAEGNYELPLHERSSHLVEASLHIDLGPARQRISVPDEGDPSPLDFHLEPTGTVYGELTKDGEPVAEAYVDIYRDGEWVLDTEVENGFFNFTDDPPVGVPLELRIKSEAGYPERPVEFTWKGQPLNLGRIELLRFPAVRVKLLFPDGTQASEFDAVLADPNTASNLMARNQWRFTHPLAVEGDLVKVPPPARKVAVILGALTADYTESHVVRRELEPGDSRIPEVEIRIAKGPIEHKCTLVDVEGRPLRARLADDSGNSHETDVEGRLKLELPHGGLHLLPLSALQDWQTGEWWTLRGQGVSVVLDSDRPGQVVRVDFSRRILIRLGGACNLQFRREFEGRHKFFPVGESAWYTQQPDLLPAALGDAAGAAVLSPPLHEGVWHWARGKWAKDARGRFNWIHDFDGYRDWPRVRFAKRGLTHLDVR